MPAGRHLRRLNVGRAIAVTALLAAAFAIEVFFAPRRSLRWLYVLAGLGYGAILLYAALDRRLRDRPRFQVLQVVGDTLLVAGFVAASGGARSPASFLFALPVMEAAALWGLRGGVVAGSAAWILYGAMLSWASFHGPAAELPLGWVLWAGSSHLLGFLVLGVLGGVLADRLRAVDRELTEHKGRLATLRAQHAEIVESIDTGLLCTDDLGVIVFVNRAGMAILRRTESDLLGTPITTLFDLSETFFAEAALAQKAGRRCRFERTWRRPADGEDLSLGFTVSRLRSQSGEEGWLTVFQDLTEIASLEAQVRTRERMAALGEMAAGMAHELRNPLAAISGCVQMLSAADGPKDRRALGDVAQRETERLNRIIRDFLDFARPGEFRPRPVDLAQMREDMSRLLRQSAERRPEHEIRVSVRGGRTWALADPDRMRQVFWNLAGNALKAMPAGGALDIEVGGYAGDHVQLSFKDQGEGMDEETLARLFEPFHGRFQDGAGLGAAIVYRIVEEHGGRVQVVSRPGRGTEIRIILPAAQPAAAGAAPALAGAARG